jgi:hypothetical protein
LNFRIFGCALFVLFAIGGAQTSLDRINESFRELNATLEDLSKSAVLHGRDTNSVSEIFNSVLRQYPSILSMSTIGPDGMIRSTVTAAGSGRRLASVADEQWFSQLMATQRPYGGIVRTQQGAVQQFRAWPIFEQSSPGSRLAGILTARIDLKKFLADIQKNGSSPLLVLHRNTPLLRRNWDEAGDYAEGTVRLTNDEELVVRYRAGASPASEATAPQQTAPSLPAVAPDSSKPTASETARTQTPRTVAETAPNNPLAPPRPATFFTDSILSTSDSPLSIRPSTVVLIIAMSLAFVLLVLIVIVFLVSRTRRQRRRDTRSSIMVSPGPTSAIVIENSQSGIAITNTVPPGTETLAVEEITSPERETKALPAIRELIAESTRKLRDLDKATDPIQRDQLLHDIQDNLTLWVNGELRQLTDRLDRISDSIKESEKHNGKSAEMQVLRYEIGRIIGEIEGLAKKIPVA